MKKVLYVFLPLVAGLVLFSLIFSRGAELISGDGNVVAAEEVESYDCCNNESERKSNGSKEYGEITPSGISDESTGEIKDRAGIGSAEIAVMQEFEKSRGFFDSNVREQYERYEAEVLSHLSREGDMLATQTLANQAERAGETNQAVDLFITAAAQGSTRSLIDISSVWFNEYLVAKSRQDDEHAKKSKLETYAWNEVLRMRNHPSVDQRTDFYKEVGMTLNAEEKKVIQYNAEQYYRMLKKRREMLGYGEFDNTVPEEVFKLGRAIEEGTFP